MEIAVLSDTHNNLKGAEGALNIVRKKGLKTIIHCGDITGPETVALFKDFDAYFALGNMDGDYNALSNAVKPMFGEGKIAPFLEIELDGVRLAACHGHTRTLDRLIESEKYDFVFHGHTHRRRDETVAGASSTTRIVNPGALGGLKAQPRSFCIVNLETRAVQFIEA